MRDAEGKQRDGGTAPSGHLGFVVIHPKFGRRYAYADAEISYLGNIALVLAFFSQFRLKSRDSKNRKIFLSEITQRMAFEGFS